MVFLEDSFNELFNGSSKDTFSKVSDYYSSNNLSNDLSNDLYIIGLV